LVCALALVAVGILDRSPAAATPLTVLVSAAGPELDGPAALASFDFTLLFDAGITVQSVNFGSNLGDPADSIQEFDATVPGALTLSELSFLLDLSGQPDAFVLATLLFDVPGENLAAALASIHIDPTSPGLGDELGNAIPLSLLRVSSPDQPISPVPEPSTLTLLGSVIALVATVTRRQRRG
jgi:hypothetical protein